MVIYVNKIMFLVRVVGLATLASCTTIPLPQLEPVLPADYDAMNYYHWADRAPPDAVLEELSRLEASAGGAEDESLVQLAVLISARTANPQQEKRALDLLTQFERRATVNPVKSDYFMFAGLWREVLNLRLQTHTAGERVTALEKERESLREQIEALTSIEQQLDRREDRGAIAP